MVTYIAYYSRSVLLQDAKSRGAVGMDVRTWEGGPKIARVATEVVELAIARHGWLQRVELGLGRGVGGWDGDVDAVRERTRSGCVDGEGKGVRFEVGAAAIGNGRERELVSAQGGLRERMRCTRVGVAGGASLIVSRNKPVQAWW